MTSERWIKAATEWRPYEYKREKGRPKKGKNILTQGNINITEANGEISKRLLPVHGWLVLSPNRVS